LTSGGAGPSMLQREAWPGRHRPRRATRRGSGVAPVFKQGGGRFHKEARNDARARPPQGLRSLAMRWLRCSVALL
jgi:hypothetical protein